MSYKSFKNGREIVEDFPSYQIDENIKNDGEIVEEFDMFYEFVHFILVD